MHVSKKPPKNSIRQYVFDIGKIIEGALNGDQARVTTYADRLRGRLEQDGEHQAALRLQNLIRGQGTHVARLSDVAEVKRSVPVDGESRLPIADFDPSPSGIETLILEPEVKVVVDRLVSSVQRADELMARGLSASPSLLIHGPPGVGKTVLARAIAQRLELPLITARTDALVSSYLGSTAKNIRMLFEHASARPCVLFLDEFDAIGKMRDDTRELGELKRVVISLLQNIDALGSDNVLIAATNHDHLLDPAIWRRFTHKLKLGAPSEYVRRGLFEKFLSGELSDSDLDVLAKLTDGATGADIRRACDESLRTMVLSGHSNLDFGCVVRMAMRSMGDDAATAPSEQLVARLASRFGAKIPQATIGRAVGLSQSQVSRILSAIGGHKNAG